MSHTPGPWNAIRSEVWVGKRRICPIVGAGESLSLPDEMERSKANARLISAAPDLLEALEYLVALLPDPELDPDDVQRGYVESARAAIKKARGEQ